MGTVSGLIDDARYDLIDYETGIVFEDAELLNFLNRMIKLMDSELTAVGSHLVHGTEEDIDTVASQDYVDISNMNNGYFDSLRSFWIGSDRLVGLSVDEIYYERKFRSGDAYPFYWALDGDRILFETTADAAHTDVTIHYNKKNRPRLASWSSAFTAANATELFTVASDHEFTTGDGRFQVSNSGGALPTGLSTSTDYWIIVVSPTTFRLATSRVAAMENDYVTISDDGTGTQTITLTDYMPYNGIFDDFLREQMVMYAKAKREGALTSVDPMYASAFRKRVMEESLRKEMRAPEYYIEF